jgi:hypothetical protein
MLGTSVLAAYALGRRVMLLALMPGWGYSTAASTLVGQAIGAGDDAAAMNYGWQTLRIGLATQLLLAVVLVAGAGPSRPSSGPSTSRSRSTSSVRSASGRRGSASRGPCGGACGVPGTRAGAAGRGSRHCRRPVRRAGVRARYDGHFPFDPRELLHEGGRQLRPLLLGQVAGSRPHGWGGRRRGAGRGLILSAITT